MDEKVKKKIKQKCAKNRKYYEEFYSVKPCNIMEVFRVKENEIRHSNVLAYLLDGRRNGCIGNRLIKWLVKEADMGRSQKDDLLKAIKKKEYEIEREYSNKSINKKFIDLFIVFDKLGVIVIENKVKAEEDKSQLDDYYDLAKDKANSMKYKSPIFVFLTPEGRETQYSKKGRWQPLSYMAIEREVEKIKGNLEKRKKGKYKKENAMIVNDYLEVLRNVVNKDIKREEYANYSDCINDSDLRDSIIGISKYVKNCEVRRLLLDQFFEQKDDVESLGGGNYIQYHPKAWEIEQEGCVVKGDIIIDNRPDTSAVSLRIRLSWEDKDDMQCKGIADKIRDYYQKNSTKFGLECTSKKTGKKKYNFMSLGYKTPELIKDSKDNKKTEAEKCADMIKRLNVFIQPDGDYEKLNKFFEGCEKRTW